LSRICFSHSARSIALTSGEYWRDLQQVGWTVFQNWAALCLEAMSS